MTAINVGVAFGLGHERSAHHANLCLATQMAVIHGLNRAAHYLDFEQRHSLTALVCSGALGIAVVVVLIGRRLRRRIRYLRGSKGAEHYTESEDSDLHNHL